MSDVMNHDWLKGEIPSKEEVQKMFAERNAAVQASIQADKEKKDAEKQTRMANRDATMRSANEEGEEDPDLLPAPKKDLEKYEKLFATKTQFFSTYHPDMIEQALLTYLRTKVKIEPIEN